MEQFLSKIQKQTIGFFLIIVIILAVSVFAYSIEPKWFSNLRQVKPMITTKQEVEKLFDYPKVRYTFDGEWSKKVDYILKEGELSVFYSQGRCSEMKTEGYDVEKYIVIDIDMDLKKEVSISKLNLDLSRFEKTEINDLIGVFSYVNEDSGEWVTGTTRKISSFKRFPAKSQENLKCKDVIKN